MLAIFLAFYFSHEKQADERLRVMEEKKAAKAAEDKKQKEVAEEKARESAKKAQEAREIEDRKKEEDRQKKEAAIDKDIADSTAAAVAEGDKSQKEINALELQLDTLHKQKDQLSRQTFDLLKQVEMAKTDRRSAELENQRYVEMIARRAADSSMTRMPAPPPAPPAR